MIGENAMKDSELIQKVHSGNKEAVGIIIERYYADIYRFCLYMVQTEDDAYDIAQETFLKFMKYGTSHKHHNLKGYLLTIAKTIQEIYARIENIQQFPYMRADLAKRVSFRTDYKYVICGNYVVLYKIGKEYVGGVGL